MLSTKKRRCSHLCVCHIGKDRVAQTAGTGETLGVEPFRKFNIPIFVRIDKAVDAFVEEKWYTKVFGMFWEVVVCIFQ